MRNAGVGRGGLLAAAMLLVGGSGASAQVDVTGTWALALEGAFAAQTWTLEVGRGADGAPTATLTMGGMGSAPLTNVELEGSTLTGGFTADMHGQRMTITVTSTFEGDSCRGAASGFPMGTISWTGRRERG